MTTTRSTAFRLALACSLAGVVAVAGAQTTMAASGAMGSDMPASGAKMKHKPMMKKATPGTHEAEDMNTARSTATPASTPMKGSMSAPSSMAASSPRK